MFITKSTIQHINQANSESATTVPASPDNLNALLFQAHMQYDKSFRAYLTGETPRREFAAQDLLIVFRDYFRNVLYLNPDFIAKTQPYAAINKQINMALSDPELKQLFDLAFPPHVFNHDYKQAFIWLLTNDQSSINPKVVYGFTKTAHGQSDALEHHLSYVDQLVCV